MVTPEATVRWGNPDDTQACLALAILNQERHAQLGVAEAGQTGFWRWRIGEAAGGGRVLLGPEGARRVEAWRLIVAEEPVTNPLGLGESAAMAIVGMLVAVLHGAVREDGETGPLRCRIDNAYVRPGFRRRGHTHRMVDFLGGWAKMFEVVNLELQVAKGNALGRAAWGALGFEQTAETVEDRFLAMSRRL